MSEVENIGEATPVTETETPEPVVEMEAAPEPEPVAEPEPAAEP